MAMSEKDKKAAKVKREVEAKAEKVRVASLTDEQKVTEKAVKDANRPVLTVVISALDIVLVTMKTQNRAYSRAIAMVAKSNDLNCVVTAEVKAREVKFKGV
ncbi:hypothetical protein LCGC14_1372210 [marine sediment metagenome]|uniref:Uncharacterized protein n=1 Tax=marine sediment metagenome TaxID=412755 RepID=A0A0F9K548_9ZZZZ